jgi:hypothetical protein
MGENPLTSYTPPCAVLLACCFLSKTPVSHCVELNRTFDIEFRLCLIDNGFDRRVGND